MRAASSGRGVTSTTSPELLDDPGEHCWASSCAGTERPGTVRRASARPGPLSRQDPAAGDHCPVTSNVPAIGNIPPTGNPERRGDPGEQRRALECYPLGVPCACRAGSAPWLPTGSTPASGNLASTRTSWPTRVTEVISSRARSRSRRPPGPPTAAARAEQLGGQVPDHPVDQAGAQEGRREGGAALQQDVVHLVGGECSRGPPPGLLREDPQRGEPVAQGGPDGISRRPITTRIGWTAAGAPCSSRAVSERIVGQGGTGADENRVDLGTQLVDLGSRRLPGDPAAGAVGAAMRPSRVLATFQVTNGRPCVTAKVHATLSVAASSPSTPPTTSTPAAARRAAPPAARGSGRPARRRPAARRPRSAPRCRDRCGRCGCTARG